MKNPPPWERRKVYIIMTALVMFHMLAVPIFVYSISPANTAEFTMRFVALLGLVFSYRSVVMVANKHGWLE